MPVTYVRKMQLQLTRSKKWSSTDTEHKPIVQPAISCAHPSIAMGIPKDVLEERGWEKDNTIQIIGC